MWGKEERRELGFAVIEARRTNADEVEATATRAVELAAARGGTMTASERAELGDYADGLADGRPVLASLIRQSLKASAVLGARNSVLEAERDALKAELHHLREDWTTTWRERAETAESELARLKANHPAPSESSGQVAEDERALSLTIDAACEDATFEAKWGEKDRAALSRLAAGAQREETLRGWLADLTEMLLGERPVGAMPGTTKDALRAVLKARDDAQQQVGRLTAHLSRVVGERDGLLAGLDLLKGEMDAIRKRSLAAVTIRAKIGVNGISAAMAWVVDGPQCVACGEEPVTQLEQDPPALGAKCAAAVAPGATFNEHGAKRYPCSDTCTHDDAATPGHPERVKERSEAVTAAVDVPEDYDWGESEPDPYQRGSEAMRAACWEAAQARCERWGFSDGFRADLKAAIEGATP
jgi:hypothetical protein